ncbi:hypothetical protein DVH05_002703 [Phytophthora capsici]|nr:hypothetical protein DVH05_002703 [Phytophthora capsici]
MILSTIGAAQENPQTTLAEIETLYDHSAMILCSAEDGSNQISAIPMCYAKLTHIQRGPDEAD